MSMLICVLTAHTCDITITVAQTGHINRCDDSVVDVKSSAYLASAEIRENSYLVFYDQVRVSNPYAGQDSEEGEEQAVIDSLLATYPDRSVVTIQKQLQLKKQDLKTLDDGKWLNDQVVNLYFKLLERESPNISVLDVFFFIDVIIRKNDSDKWFKADTFRKPKILIPVIQNRHWCLVVLEMKNQTVKTLDSCTEPNMCGTLIRNFLETCKKCPSRWCIQRAKHLPKQMNENDCGIFMCQFAACETLNIEPDFRQEDIQRYRRAMKVECFIGQLLPRAY